MANRKTKNTELNLHVSAHAGHLEGVRRALDAGQKVNAKDNEGHSALALAIGMGQTDVVRLLLENGADHRRRDSMGFQALHTCLMSCNIKKTKDRLTLLTMLVDAGANVNANANYAGKPLTIAVNFGRSQKIQNYLRSKGATA